MEILVAVVVLAIGLWALAGAFPLSAVTSAGAHNRLAASAAAEARLELCRALPFDQLPIGSYRFAVAELPEGTDATLTVQSLAAGSEGVKVATVTISWPGLGSGPASGGRVSYVTLVAQR